MARSNFVQVSVEHWHELPDDITRKDGHGNVAVAQITPYHVAILPTDKSIGNNNNVLIAKVFMSMAKRNMFAG